jgi:hypothetical protein
MTALRFRTARRLGFVAAIVLCVVVVPSSAQALTLSPSAPRLQRMLDTSRMPLAPVTVQYDPTAARCPPDGACADGSYFGVSRSERRTDHQLRALLFHEAGHVFDFDVLTDSERQAFLNVMPGQAHRTWWEDDPGRAAPGEWFADSYMWCARRPASQISPDRHYVTGDGATPGAVIVRICRMIHEDA